MENAATYQVDIEYSTVPTRYDSQLGSDTSWTDYADPTKAIREAHSDSLEFISPAPMDPVGEDGVVDEPAVLKQLEIQVREHLERVCPEGYDLDGFTARVVEEED